MLNLKNITGIYLRICLTAQPKTHFRKLGDILSFSGWIIIAANKKAVICRHYKVLYPQWGCCSANSS